MDINIFKFEALSGNTYFILSFLITIYYWIKAIFFSQKNYQSYGFWGFVFINILLTCQLLIRWGVSGHFPLSSLYESLLFLAWALITIYIAIENFIKTEFIGVIIAPILLCILTFSGFSLPSDLQTIKPLVPALQSNWLFMHVSVMMLSYAALLIGSILAITYLVIFNFVQIKTNSLEKSTFANKLTKGIEDTFSAPQIKGIPDTFVSDLNNQLSTAPFLTFSSGKNTVIDSNFSKSESIQLQRQTILENFNNFLNVFDNLSYRTIGIGFCFLTLGILSGAVWANETWGTYWSWDPKETWALITWLTFAAYLHTRLLYGWQGVKPATIASLGFLFIWICYLGVNLLGKGLHSYGFFN